ncbi:MAG: hypothetical protein EH225_10110 [Calditrichaeota bacterium]|nr:hypothetical protein [Calditrichota bacterium]RQW00811.1 MAG: hypothetical protein EH225_10110 [Calditrichota bacterium]
MTEIAGLSLREDSVLWTELARDEKLIHIKKTVFETLPVFINHKTMQLHSTTATLSKFLKDIIKNNNLSRQNIRVTIPGRFAIIKKIPVDKSIPAESVPELIFFEFEKSWEESPQNYHIYLPENMPVQNSSENILAVAIRKNTLDFFNKLLDQAGLSVEMISPSCFTVEELFKRFFPRSGGQSILLGWNRRGFDAIITDGEEFLNYFFRSYTINFDPIEKVTEYDLASSFSNIIFDIQNPTNLEHSLYDINNVYNFGYYFTPEWLEFMRSRIQLPINLFNYDVTSNFQITSEDSRVSSENIFKYIESLSPVI